MTVKYYAILTNQGAARLANATMLGSKLNLTQMAVGDANGVLPTPDPAQTKLINQKRIAPLNLLSVDPNNQSQIIAEQIIPENEGGFWIREIGLYDDEGVLIAVANCPETYKPQLQEGSGRTQTIRMILVVSNTEAITLKIDPSVVLATRQYVDQQIEVHEQSRRHPSASLTEKGFVRLYSGVESNDETVAATPKAVKIAMDNASARLAKDRNGSDIPNPALFVQNLGLKPTVDKAESALQQGAYGIGSKNNYEMGEVSQFLAYSGNADEVPSNGAGFQAAYNKNRRAQIFITGAGEMYHRFSGSDTVKDSTTLWRRGVCEDEFSFGSNYHRITGGVLKQFFNSYFSGETGVVNKNYQVNFPTPFARQCWYVIPVFRSAHGGSVEGVAITTITATGFTLSITGDNGGWNIGFIAEGV
ncbi:phage tail protein [Escherichia coli]